MAEPTSTPPGNNQPGNTAPNYSQGSAGSNRFFNWMRGLGIVRSNGWIGGVCGGIAERLGIDPLIVRGILVVIAVLGGPAFLFYAAAWLLLPDSQDNIHLERLISGRLDPPVVAIAVIALLSFLPVTQGIWWAGAQFWSEPFWPAAVGRTLWSLVIVGLIVAVIVWAARSNRWTSRGEQTGARTASATPPAPGAGFSDSTANLRTDAAGAAPFAATTAPATGHATAGSATAEPAPPASQAPSDPEGLEAWKESQAQWKAEHDAWRSTQDAEQRAVRQQRSAEIRAQSQAMAAEANEARRQRRLANPRTSGAYIGITFGVAILAGAITTAVAFSTPDIAGYAVTIGLASATLVFGLAIILAGVLRRRSGFLSFVSILLVLASVLTALPPRGRDLVIGSAHDQGVASTRVFVPLGTYSLYLDANSGTTSPDATRVIDVQQGIGQTQVYIVRGLTVRVEATQQTGGRAFDARTINQNSTTAQDPTITRLADGAVRSSISYGAAAMPDVIVRITQWVGSVDVVYDRTATDGVPGSSTAPTPPLTTSTPGAPASAKPTR
ncbi:PspC domain-containing protein [Rathayibacter soli]|uniref:PspC domain-containing protein n=1 Tax=Rathayibacter soli TaxID=3144168 RepID=UPI0027E506A7|nr:PspC domain-containing protein [Glaciibacter superstes]